MHWNAQCEHRGMHTGETQLPVHREQAWYKRKLCLLSGRRVGLLDVTELDVVANSAYRADELVCRYRVCFGTCF